MAFAHNPSFPRIGAKADAITIETSRSDMDLFDAFKGFECPNETGPGVYGIHSPNIPAREHIAQPMRNVAERIPKKRLRVNPDRGLETRAWAEIIPALQNMVAGARQLRETN